MKPYERHQEAAYPYFKLAQWDPRSMTFRDGKKAFPTKAQAQSSASGKGIFRVSRVDQDGRQDLASFERPAQS